MSAGPHPNRRSTLRKGVNPVISEGVIDVSNQSPNRFTRSHLRNNLNPSLGSPTPSIRKKVLLSQARTEAQAAAPVLRHPQWAEVSPKPSRSVKDDRVRDNRLYSTIILRCFKRAGSHSGVLKGHLQIVNVDHRSHSSDCNPTSRRECWSRMLWISARPIATEIC